jgi:hypothetical protein
MFFYLCHGQVHERSLVMDGLEALLARFEAGLLPHLVALGAVALRVDFTTLIAYM